VMLKLNELNFKYGLRKQIFTNFNAEFRPGTVTALLGLNGTGKTTLLKLCCGLLVPAKGKVSINGALVSLRQRKALEHIFFVPDTLELPAVTALKFGELNGAFYSRFDYSYYEQLLSRLTVPADKKLTGLSFGQQKKAYLAFAFAAQTSYLLLDEPTNGLDPNSMVVLKQVIAESACSNRSILISTHHLADVENLCDDFMILNDKHKAFHTSLENILDSYHFGRADNVPPNAIYQETTFGSVFYMRRRESGEPVSPFNLPLYMNAVLTNTLHHEEHIAAV